MRRLLLKDSGAYFWIKNLAKLATLYRPLTQHCYLSGIFFNVRSPITPPALGLTTQKSRYIRKLISSKNSSIALHQKTIYHTKDKNPGDEKKGGNSGGFGFCDSWKKNRYPVLARRKYLFEMTLVKSTKYLEAPNIAFNVLIPWKNQ